ncbi:hypothetical protein SMC26_37705 [Actinomadura fulvescens]|uniref:aromatic-ring hydroxylase C-terminal domain-containing protein n=1 Tax=Actinomadura fulvescens TaxID=46160 RepID=UPI0031D3F922
MPGTGEPLDTDVLVVGAGPTGLDVRNGEGLHPRPDGHVAWVNGEETGLADALHRWFGAPFPRRRSEERRSA